MWSRKIINLDNKGQMMVLETIFFTATVILSIVFLYQLSPQSIINEASTDDLRVIGNDALLSIYNDVVDEVDLSGYPSSKLVHGLIANEYGAIVSDLGNFLPSTALYNIYVSNGVDTVFWCDSHGNTDENNILTPQDPVAISHCLVAIDPTYFSSDTNDLLRDGEANSFASLADIGSVYEVRLMVWYI